jgi:hypothetical protein
MADGCDRLELNTETPIMEQFSVNCIEHTEAFQAFLTAQDEVASARRTLRAAEAKCDDAHARMDRAIRACHSHLLVRMKSVAGRK